MVHVLAKFQNSLNVLRPHLCTLALDYTGFSTIDEDDVGLKEPEDTRYIKNITSK